MSRVDLGFLEKTDSWLLKSNHFPSKIGGKPSWLNLKELPSTEQLQCKKCSQPMIFLCQVYAPVEENDSCFHRAIFIFICRQESCCSRNDNNNIIVWRSQLRRENDFYSPEPPAEDQDTDFSIEHFSKLCAVCGVSASKHCSKCKTTSYCSREHQLVDWKTWHKNNCGTNKNISDNENKILFEEWELVIEAEEEKKDEAETPEEADKRRLEEYNELVVEGKTGTMTDIPESDLETHAAVDQDKTFSQFRKRIAANPDQVLRYDRGGEPIWIANYPKPTEIPNCENCNSSRQFEFQILPQLLYSLHENNLDWGTLAVYTCKENCDSGSAYKKEFIFKQDVSGSSNNEG